MRSHTCSYSVPISCRSWSRICIRHIFPHIQNINQFFFPTKTYIYIHVSARQIRTPNECSFLDEGNGSFLSFW